MMGTVLSVVLIVGSIAGVIMGLVDRDRFGGCLTAVGVVWVILLAIGVLFWVLIFIVGCVACALSV